MPRLSILLATLLFCGCSGSPGGEFGSFWSGLPASPAVEASAFRNANEQELKSCPARRCLTVYIAPWCHYCRSSTPALLALRDYLTPLGVATRFIVGMDKPAALADYASTFGPDTRLDEAGRFVSGGVPHFYVTDNAGRLLKDQAGVPAGEDDPQRLAALLGLP